DPHPARPAADTSGEAGARREKVIEALAEAFIGPKNGYEQFGLEGGGRTPGGKTPPPKARPSRAGVHLLLPPPVGVGAAIHDLISIFADFGIHHIAMMEGVTEGTRSLLQSLDPRANGLDGNPGILSKSRHRELWNAYLERFDQLLSDGNDLHVGIFG